MSVNGNKTRILESFISTAEYLIGNYLKDHPDCTTKELMPHVIGHLSTKENQEGKITRKPQPIHTLAFLIAIKELEAESVIRIDRGNVPFPMTDFESKFSLSKP